MSKRKASKPPMSNRKPATASKRSSPPKVAARAQRNKHELVRSRRDKHLRPVAAGGLSESSAEVHGDQKQESSIIENRAAALHAILLTPQDGFTQKVKETSEPNKGFEGSSLTSNIQAYQATLLEVVPANVQFFVEFTRRLATVKSPFEFWAVIAEFTGRRMLMIGKHSKEMTAAVMR
jgi:hypothetical protein